MILDDIVSKKRSQLELEKIEKPLEEILDKINDVNLRNFKEALCKDRISIIGEIKMLPHLRE